MTPEPLTRAQEIHIARVHLAQARAFRARGSIAFAATLLDWAANARRRAARGQAEMFR